MAEGQGLQIGASPAAVKRALNLLEKEAAGKPDHPKWSRLVTHRRVVDLLDRGVSLEDIRKCSEQNLEGIDEVLIVVDDVSLFFCESNESNPARAIIREQLQTILNRK